MLRRTTFLGAAAALAAPVFLRATPAAAQAATSPAATAQAPGFYRIKVGAFTATIVHDGFFNFPNAGANFVRNAPQAAVETAMREGGLDPAAMRVPFNITFVETPRGLIAFDTGTGGQMAPTAGNLTANMAAAGLDPARVTQVVFTHFHPDHISGLTRADNSVVFPNAEILVPAPEWAFWMDDAAMSRAPEGQRGVFMGARRRFGPYAGKIRQIASDAEVAPGIRAVATPGHTPGHTSYLVADGADQLLVLGDVTNRPEVNLRNPDWHVVFDMDAALAATNRRALFDRLAADRIRTVGYHWPFPANGYVVKAGEGYRFAPAEWTSIV